jgi:hypothetical protein
MISGGIYFLIGAVSLIVNWMFVHNKNLGGNIVLNDAYYAEVFQNPLF